MHQSRGQAVPQLMPRICVCGLTNLKLKDLNVKQKQSLQGGAYSNSFSHTFGGDPPGRTTNLHERFMWRPVSAQDDGDSDKAFVALRTDFR